MAADPAPTGRAIVSLQYTKDAVSELSALREAHGVEVIRWLEAIDDDETVALMSALDPTISVCTAVIDLGGALGRSVWMMTPMGPKWHYGFAESRCLGILRSALSVSASSEIGPVSSRRWRSD